MHTVLQSPSKTVTIGPTSRSASSASGSTRPVARSSRPSCEGRPVADRGRRRAAGRRRRHMLDVNMGAPLADEAGLLPAAIKLIQSLTDLPLCIDSSVVEALEAGLAAYEGKALVNSVTAEDERHGAILPLVKKYGAAVIALPNDDEIPMDPQRAARLTGRSSRSPASTASRPRTSSSTRSRCRSAPTPTLRSHCSRRSRLIRDDLRREHDLRRVETCRSAAQPAHAQRRVPPDRRVARTDERDHGRPLRGDRRGRRGGRPPAGHDEWGAQLDRATAPARRRLRVSDRGRARSPLRRRRRRALPAAGRRASRSSFEQADGQVRAVRVPATRTTLFDAASWNGIAIDSTCGGHGTCKKCKVRVVDGGTCRRLDPRAFSPRGAEGRLAARLPGPCTRDLVVEVPPLQTRPRPPRRRRPAGDPAPGGAEALPRADRADARRPGTDLERVRDAMDDLELRVPLEARCARSGARCARRLEGHRGGLSTTS
jgi:ferredoxin